jgi:hypothetical protein
MATTVQQIVTSATTDIMNQIGTNHPVLLDYCNRISYDMLRATKWDFLLSDVQSFITRQGVTAYWIGALGQAPEGTYDTGLNITNIKWVQHGSVFDRSNFQELGSVASMPVSAVLNYTDGTSRPGRPCVYRNNVDTPFVLNIYPAPDQQNNQAPQPEPILTGTTTGGSLPARQYNLIATLVDALGNESTAPDYTTPIYIPANSLAVGFSPTMLVPTNDAGVPYNQWNIYASANNNIPQNATKQNASPIALGTNWTEPTSGLITTGVNPPSDNLCSTYNGYIIQFRYYEIEQAITSFTQDIQIPDRYIDVMTAGVNWLALKFLSRSAEAMEWYGTYKTGMVAMVHDRNQQNRFADYISPDPSSVGGFLPTIETIDLSLLTP